MKEIYICGDGIIIVYRYLNNTRYITHKFDGIHNGRMVKFSFNKDRIMEDTLCRLKRGKKIK